MNNDLTQQIIGKVSQVSNILILAFGNEGDSLSPALAMRSFLQKMEKDVTLFSLTPVASKFGFLPFVTSVDTKLDLSRSFVIDVNVKTSQLAELTYKKDDEKLSIFLKPKEGQFTPQDVSFRSSNFKYELVILIGISSLEQLGEFYSGHADLFFDTPMVNIDFKAQNENYGQFNLVNLSATSSSEIVFDFITKFEASLIDETIATQLLTGIISETNSFQHIRTNPQTFIKASQLVGFGAKQQEIISHLYKTKSMGFLKLWGRVLARLKQEVDANLVYSIVNAADVAKSEAMDEDVDLIIREMAGQLGFAKNFLFLREESPDSTQVFCSSLLPINLANMFSLYNPKNEGLNIISFKISSAVGLVEEMTVFRIKQEMQKLIGHV